MVVAPVQCPHCGSDKVKKNGTSKNGKQRFSPTTGSPLADAPGDTFHFLLQHRNQETLLDNVSSMESAKER